MGIKVEPNIPIPYKAAGRMSELSRAMRSMKVGDSILITRLQSMGVGRKAVNFGIKIATRKEGDDMIRVWRLK